MAKKRPTPPTDAAASPNVTTDDKIRGRDVWGKQLRLLVKSDPRDPILSSFRQLTQQIHRAAREHVLFFSDDPTP